MPVRDDKHGDQGAVATWAGKERMKLYYLCQVLGKCAKHILSRDFWLRALLRGSPTKCKTVH